MHALAQVAGQFAFEVPVAAQVEAVVFEYDGGVVVRADRECDELRQPIFKGREGVARFVVALPFGFTGPGGQVEAAVALLQGVAGAGDAVEQPVFGAVEPVAELGGEVEVDVLDVG